MGLISRKQINNDSKCYVDTHTDKMLNLPPKMLHITIVILNVVLSIHASHMPVNVSVCWCRTHHHPTQQSFAEFGQIEPQRKRLPHCIPESKCVQGLITVQTISRCRVVAGLID